MAACIIFIGFLAYEITEGIRIHDWAYRDIGGHLIGFTGYTAARMGLNWFVW